MEIEKPAGVEIKSNNSLMKKTKAQLIEIILRKDDVEKSLREEFRKNKSEYDSLVERHNYLKQSYNNTEVKYSRLLRDYEDACDDHVTQYTCLKDKLNGYKKIAAISTCVAIVALLTIIVLFVL